MSDVEKPAWEIENYALTPLERKERKVVELRQLGLTFDIIAERVGYASASGAFHAYERYMERYKGLPAEKLRELQGSQLDRLLPAVYTKALRGDPAAIAAVMKIFERQAKLFGLDAPNRSESTITIDDGRDDLDESVRRFAYLIAEARQNNAIGYNAGESISVGSDGEIESITTDGGMEELADPLGSRMGEDEMRGGVDSLGSVEIEEDAVGGSSENS